VFVQEPEEPAELEEPEEPGEQGKPEEPGELEELEEPGEPKKPGELEELGEYRKLEEDLVWDERPPGEDDRPLPVRMDWSVVTRLWCRGHRVHRRTSRATSWDTCLHGSARGTREGRRWRSSTGN
jgi:hypothetical protein